MPTRGKGKKKAKNARDLSAYATTSIPSNRRIAPKVEIEIEIEGENPSLPPPSILSSQTNTASPEPTHKNPQAIATWVSLDLAKRQSASRIQKELSLASKLTKQTPAAKLSKASEQLVIDKVRSGALALAPSTNITTEAPEEVSLKDWTKSTNFVYQTLEDMGFSSDDIKVAMSATHGAGDMLEVLTHICFMTPTDRLPVDMRDKIELTHSTANPPPADKSSTESTSDSEQCVSDAGLAQVDTSTDTNDTDLARTDANTDTNDTGLARIDTNADISDEHGLADGLADAFDSLGLDNYDSDEYDSDEDPAVSHARRAIRLKAYLEWQDAVRSNNQRNRYAGTLETLAQLAQKEKSALAEIEDDWLFDSAQADREYDRLWAEYRDPLWEKIKAFNVQAADTVDEPKQTNSSDPNKMKDGGSEKAHSDSGFDMFDDDSDSDGIGLGLGFGMESDDDAPYVDPGAPSDSPRVVFDAEPPAGWTGAPIKDIVRRQVSKADPQATIKYTTSARSIWFVSNLSVSWSKRSTDTRRKIIAHKDEDTFETSAKGSITTQTWKMPRSIVGRTKRDAEAYASLMFLYTRSDSDTLLAQLAPPLRDEWMAWTREQQASDDEKRKESHESRVEYITELHAEYAKTTSTPTPENDVDYNEIRDKAAYRAAVKHARGGVQIRARKWASPTVLCDRHMSKAWESKFKEFRATLPSQQHKQDIVGAIRENQVIVLRGETGCGKSTQVPQFVLEMLLESKQKYAGGQVLCTQPRRISTMSIAERVSQEVGDTVVGRGDSLVGYQVRFNSRAATENALVFCTVGVLLRRLTVDPMLEGIECIICDEIQERTLDLDYLLIVIRRLIKRRKTLKVILMSATIDVSLFTQYFDGCPVVEVPGRTFPVENMFLEDIIEASRYTIEDGSRYAVRGSSKGNQKYQMQVSTKGGNSYSTNVDVSFAETHTNEGIYDIGFHYKDREGADEYVSPRSWETVHRIDPDKVNLDLISHIISGLCKTTQPTEWHKYCAQNMPSGSVLVFLPGLYEIRTLHGMLESDTTIASQTLVVPLHSMFANERLPGSTTTYTEAAFASAPAGKRKVVLATNVAETGITIPDITIVVDSGFAKQKVWDAKRHITHLTTKRISKASAKQRRGRAGRVQQGMALSLFTRKQHTLMGEFEVPEMQRLPLASICLMTKAHGVRDIVHFLQMAVEPPSQSAVVRAVCELQRASALDENEELTPIGRHLCYLPVDLPIGKLLVYGVVFRCLDPVLTIAAGLSSNTSVFIVPYDSSDRTKADSAHAKYRKGNGVFDRAPANLSDFLGVLAARADWKRVASQKGASRAATRKYCRQNWLNVDALEALEDLREQYMRLLHEMGLVSFTAQESMWKSVAQIIRPKTHGFVVVPEHTSAFGGNANVVYAAIAGGLDHLIVAETGDLGRETYRVGQVDVSKAVRGIGNAIRVAENERVAARRVEIDSRSINGGGVAGGGGQALVALELGAAARGNGIVARMTTRVNVVPVVLFAKSVEYWPKAKLLTVDRWADFKCYMRSAAVLLQMRKVLEAIIDARAADPQGQLSRDLEEWEGVIHEVIANEG